MGFAIISSIPTIQLQDMPYILASDGSIWCCLAYIRLQGYSDWWMDNGNT
ncbi:hypothetical protein [Methanobrevibacter sp.]